MRVLLGFICFCLSPIWPNNIMPEVAYSKPSLDEDTDLKNWAVHIVLPKTSLVQQVSLTFY